MTTRWGIAATGGMAAAFSEDLAHVPGAEIAFVGSRSPESAADFAGRRGTEAEKAGQKDRSHRKPLSRKILEDYTRAWLG